MKCQILFPEKKKIRNFKMLSAENFTLSVKCLELILVFTVPFSQHILGTIRAVKRIFCI